MASVYVYHNRFIHATQRSTYEK